MIDIRNLPELNIKQKEFVSEFYKLFLFDNSLIANVEPLLFQGAIAASEFLVYDVRKLYVCLDSVYSFDLTVNAFNGIIHFRNELNAAFNYGQNNSIDYNTITTAINYQKRDFRIKNIWFSRIVAIQYNYMRFNGYRITLV